VHSLRRADPAQSARAATVFLLGGLPAEGLPGTPEMAEKRRARAAALAQGVAI